MGRKGDRWARGGRVGPHYVADFFDVVDTPIEAKAYGGNWVRPPAGARYLVESWLRDTYGKRVHHHRRPKEVGADPCDGGCEVDCPENEHPRLGREGPDEDAHSLASTLAVGAVAERGTVAAGKQTYCVVADGIVGPLGPQGANEVVPTDD